MAYFLLSLDIQMFILPQMQLGSLCSVRLQFCLYIAKLNSTLTAPTDVLCFSYLSFSHLHSVPVLSLFLSQQFSPMHMCVHVYVCIGTCV